MNWIKVEPNPKDNDAHPELLPPIERVVHVVYHYDLNGPPAIALGGRVEGEDGWLWAINDNAYGHEKDSKWHDLTADNEYLVTNWAEIEWPDETAGELASESLLAHDWNTPEEEEACKDL